MIDPQRKYSPAQIDILLDLYFRDQPRPAPWPIIDKCCGPVTTLWPGLEIIGIYTNAVFTSPWGGRTR